ncbi:hypothetical protein NQ317_007847 [Molorchus minor]|uniref:Uncharacterized protein n=1 Tax=Molorchus minor TaxID=1323400 RepID=A0ABQ9IQ64_9CUCU|nr:hypothetical protein NQ317_007847 [Molorchus minor]
MKLILELPNTSFIKLIREQQKLSKHFVQKTFLLSQNLKELIEKIKLLLGILKERSDTKLILGDNSLAEYLSERLQCPEEVAKYLISKQPALQNKSLTKMNEMIDFLYKQGFQPIHMRRVPKILLHSVETTKKRLKEL